MKQEDIIAGYGIEQVSELLNGFVTHITERLNDMKAEGVIGEIEKEWCNVREKTNAVLGEMVEKLIDATDESVLIHKKK